MIGRQPQIACSRNCALFAPFHSWRGIGKMHADIAEPKRAEDGVGDGVEEDVGIRVSGQTELGTVSLRRRE